MFWLQVLVALGVVLATVLVAGGRGDSLGELSPSRPRTGLPGDRAVRPDDLNSLQLGVGLRGYRMDEVDDVLDVLADQLAQRDEEIARLRGERDPAARAAREPTASTRVDPADG